VSSVGTSLRITQGLACRFAPDFCLLSVNARGKPTEGSGPVLLDVKSAWTMRERLNAGSVLLVYCARFVPCDTSEQLTSKPSKA